MEAFPNSMRPASPASGVSFRRLPRIAASTISSPLRSGPDRSPNPRGFAFFTQCVLEAVRAR